jgi:hypothetical protein
VRLALAALVAGFSLTASALPEMTRHGYQRCDTCHASPDGGGTLTAYGRALSKEVLSTWGTEAETNWAYGAVKLPEWAALGGNVRFAQVHFENASLRSGRPILMQADLEAALTHGKFTADATLGIGFQKELLSRRHYVQYKPSDHWSFRAGRFYKAFGVRLPDHIVEIRRGLGWDQNQETYNLEAAYFTDGGEAFLTGQLGRPDKPALNEEKGAAFRGAFNLGDRTKIGASYFYGTRPGERRHVAGPYAILGLSPHWFVLAEMDFQNRAVGAASTTGAATYVRMGYEVYPGVVPWIAHEYSQLDFKTADTRRVLYTGGLQWFPRPHFELLGAYQRQVLRAAAGGDADFLWFMAHFYF